MTAEETSGIIIGGLLVLFHCGRVDLLAMGLCGGRQKKRLDNKKKWRELEREK